MKKLTSLALLLFAAVTLPTSANATTITNGSFETGDFTGFVTQDLPLEESLLVTDFFPVFNFGFFASPTDGDFFAVNAFDGPPGVISIAQDIFVTAAQSTIDFDFRVAFDLVNFCGDCSDRTFEVNILESGGGALLDSFEIFTAEAQTINLDSGNLLGSVDLSDFINQNIRISFDNVIPDTFSGPAFFQLDNIRAVAGPVAVPAPATLALFGIGLIGFGFKRKKA